MNEYRGKHVSSQPWAVSTSASVRRGKHEKQNRRRQRGLALLILLVVALLAYPFLEAHILTVDQIQLPSENLPADANHLRIVFVSDIHYGFWYGDLALGNLVNRINSLKPDVVIFGGDYATDNTSAIQFFRRLPNIHARYDIFGVVGEADRGETPSDLTLLEDAMRAAGVKPLVNAVAPVRVGSGMIYIAGADDAQAGKPDLSGIASKVSASDYVIFAAHNPSLIPDALLAKDRADSIGWFDLALFGHTHGGQMMYFSSLLGIADDVSERYRAGHLKANRSDLIISRGVGTSVIPARLMCYPQIHCIELTTN